MQYSWHEVDCSGVWMKVRTTVTGAPGCGLVWNQRADWPRIRTFTSLNGNKFPTKSPILQKKKNCHGNVTSEIFLRLLVMFMFLDVDLGLRMSCDFRRCSRSGTSSPRQTIQKTHPFSFACYEFYFKEPSGFFFCSLWVEVLAGGSWRHQIPALRQRWNQLKSWPLT